MLLKATSPDEYVHQAPQESRKPLQTLRDTINANLSKGFREGIQYGMIAYFVPHSIYPNGYHCKPSEPLPFMSFASQKNSINLYHMGLYAHQELYDWFVTEYPKHCKDTLDMGKSCIRFKKIDNIPYKLIGELTSKMTAEDWIEIYETKLKK